MKIMIQLLLLSLVTLTKCGEQKLDKENSDTIQFEKAVYKKWAAGIQGGGAGFTIELVLKEKNTAAVLEKIAFRDWITDLNSDDAMHYYGSINDGSNASSETTLGGNIGQNNESKKLENLPIVLEEDEAILYYTTAGKEKYRKLKLEPSTKIDNPRY